MDKQQITEQAIEVIADVLEMEFDEVSVDSKVVTDLGADSLDVVDLSFSLGKKFSIKMPQKSVIMHAEELMGDLSGLVENNTLTQFGAELLRAGPNGYNESEVYEGQSLVDTFTEMKVSHWVNLCVAIIENGISGDELIQQTVKAVLEKQVATSH